MGILPEGLVGVINRLDPVEPGKALAVNLISSVYRDSLISDDATRTSAQRCAEVVIRKACDMRITADAVNEAMSAVKRCEKSNTGVLDADSLLERTDRLRKLLRRQKAAEGDLAAAIDEFRDSLEK